MTLSKILVPFLLLFALLEGVLGSEPKALRWQRALNRRNAMRRRLYQDPSTQYYSSADFEMTGADSGSKGGSHRGSGSGKGYSSSPCGKGGKGGSHGSGSASGKGGKGGSGSASGKGGKGGSGSASGSHGKGGSGSASGSHGKAGKGGSGSASGSRGKAGKGASGRLRYLMASGSGYGSAGCEESIEEIQGEIIQIDQEIEEDEMKIITDLEEMVEQAQHVPSEPSLSESSMYSPSNDDRKRK